VKTTSVIDIDDFVGCLFLLGH